MVKVIVDNVRTEIKDCDKTVLGNIDAKLSILTPDCWFSPAYKNGYWDGYTRFFDKKTTSFPTGLLPKVLDVLSECYEPDEYKIVDKRKGLEFTLDNEHLSSIVLQQSKKELRDYQVEAVNSVTSSKLGKLKWQRGVLNLATNAGKTVIAEAIMQLFYPLLEEKWTPPGEDSPVKPVFLFATHSKEIAYQAKKSFEADLGVSVGIIGDGQWKIESITIGIISTLYSRHKNQKPEFIQLTKQVVAIVGDEIHHGSSTSYYDVLSDMKNASLRLGLTGTVDTKNPVQKMRLTALTGDILTKVSNNYLIKNNYSAKPECYMIPIDYPDVDKIKLYGRQDELGNLDYQDIYQKGIVSSMWRNYVIAKVCEKEVFENKGQVLVLVDRLEHGECIQDCFDFLDSDIRCIFLHGELDTATRQQGLDMLVNKEVDVIIATTILDEGVDVPNINALVYARGGKSIRKLLQGIGRGLRKKQDGSNLRMYDFIDDTSYVLIKQSQQRLETLQKEKFKVTKMTTEKDLGISEMEFQSVMQELDTTYDDKYIGV